MTTLAAAWDWYTAARRSLERMRRLGRVHWDRLPWDGALGRDDEFRLLLGGTVCEESELGLEPIDDLAVVVLFSVFESVVREYVVRRLRPEADALTDPVLVQAAADAVRGVEDGSFYRRVLAPLKEQGAVPADLVTAVDQVRDYRNWVAHGRRGKPVNNVDPAVAYRRLQEFLSALGLLPAEPPTSSAV